MNGNCFDIGAIQAFLDGEISPERSMQMSTHIANCSECANLLSIAEDENSFVFSTLEREINTLVPTQRLWSRINESIEVEKSKEPIWRQLYAFISTSLSSPSLTAAAGVLIVFGFLAVMWTLRSPSEITAVVDPVPGPMNSTGSRGIRQVNDGTAVTPSRPNIVDPIQVKASNLPNTQLEKLVRERNEIRATPAVYYGPLPAEQGYIKTISDLKQSVDGRKDAVFSASSRVAFERDLAVVNDAINRMQKVVRKNPNNQSAKQVLYSAYQDKIDLLNTVAQRDELMASIR